METSEKKQTIFTDKAVQNFSAFSVVLKGIHTRLMSEGYMITDERLIKPPVGDLPWGCDSVRVRQKNNEKHA